MRKKMLLALVALCVAFPASAIEWEPAYPVREVPIYGLGDVAMASYDFAGPVIYYNPTYVEQLGPELATFFRAHEYGHIHLGHVYMLTSWEGSYELMQNRKQIELAADRFAVDSLIRSGDLTAVEAAYKFFLSMGHDHSPGYPTGYERAYRIKSRALRLMSRNY